MASSDNFRTPVNVKYVDRTLKEAVVVYFKMDSPEIIKGNYKKSRSWYVATRPSATEIQVQIVTVVRAHLVDGNW